MINGVINIYKIKGFTSHDVVAKLRGMLGQKKIGHTGTLDPEATGVLPVCLGSATKLCDFLTEKEKEYIARIRLGVVTDTQDMTGRILEEKEVAVTREEAVAALERFLGDYDQIPPMYSAIKINGKKLYELARQGKEVERKARRVRINAVELLAFEPPFLTVRVSCSKGTYIRTLCHDAGQALGCGAAMEELERSRSGSFRKEDAITLEELQKRLDAAGDGGIREAVSEFLIPVDELLREYPAVRLQPSADCLGENGNPFSRRDCAQEEADPGEEARYRVYTGEGRFVGIYEYRKKENRYFPVKMFISK